MKKRIMYIVMAIVMFAMAMIGFNYKTIYGETLVTLEATKKQTNAGNKVTVYVAIKGNPGIAGMQFSVEFDDNVLTLDSATGLNKAILATPIINKEESVVNYVMAEEKNYAGNGNILKLNFSVAKDASPGEYEIVISKAMVVNSDLETRDVNIINGNIIVTDAIVIPNDNTEPDENDDDGQTEESETLNSESETTDEELTSGETTTNSTTGPDANNAKTDETTKGEVKDDTTDSFDSNNKRANKRQVSIVAIIMFVMLIVVIIALVALLIYRYRKKYELLNKDTKNILLILLCMGTGVALVSGEKSIAATYPAVTPENTSAFYYYNQLENHSNGVKMKKLYNDMLDICWEFYNSTEDAASIVNASGVNEYFIPKTLKASDYNLTSNEIDIVEDALFHDMPLFYFLGFRIHWDDGTIIYTSFVVVEGDQIKIQLTNNVGNGGVSNYYDGDRRKECKAIIESNVYKYYELTKGKSLYEKQQILFNAICANSDYNSEELMASYAHTVVGNFEGENVVCEGYTKTANLLLNYCGVDTIDISGIAGATGEEKHVWTAVKFDDGNWYLSDLTWSDTKEDYTISASSRLWEEKDCNGYYINMPASDFSENHTAWSSVSLPQFANSDRYYDSYDIYVDRTIKNSKTEAQIQEMACDTIKNELVNGNTYVSIWFDDYSYFRPFTTLIVAQMENILEEVYQQTGIRYKMLGAYNYSCTAVKEKISETGETYFVMDLAIPFAVAKDVGDYTIDSSYHIGGIDCVSITDVRKDSGVYLEIPSNIDGKPVVMYISGKGTLEYDEITIPDTMLVLYNACFRYGKMTSVRLNEGLRTIDYGAFHDCMNLKSIYVPKSVTTIAAYALGYYYDGDIRTKLPDFTIYGYAGSEAENYANSNGFKFVAVTKAPVFYGDVNDDGTVNVMDADIIKKYIAQYKAIAVNTEAADINTDGNINVLDAVKLMKKIHNVR